MDPQSEAALDIKLLRKGNKVSRSRAGAEYVGRCSSLTGGRLRAILHELNVITTYGIGVNYCCLLPGAAAGDLAGPFCNVFMASRSHKASTHASKKNASRSSFTMRPSNKDCT